jgi:hypothetical protein
MNHVIKTIIIGCLFLAFFFREILDSIQAILFKYSSVEFNWSVIPLFILTFVLLLIVHKDKKKPLPTKCSGWGVLLLGISIIAYLYIYLLMDNQFLCSIAWIFVLLGSILLLLGWNIVRIAWISFVLLFFLIPLPGRLAYHEPALMAWQILPYGIAALYFLTLWIKRNLFIEDNNPETKKTPQHQPESQTPATVKQKESIQRPSDRTYFLNDIPFLSAGIVYLAMITLKYMWIFALSNTQPLALQKPLQALDEMKLAPYKVIEKQQITNEDILNSLALGTKEYLMWRLEDMDAPQDSPVRFSSLFITYYPSKYLVYSPDITYIEGGNYLVKREQVTLDLSLSSPGETSPLAGAPLNIQYVVFGNSNTQTSNSVSVMYFFMANSRYVSSREDVENIFRNPFNKYSYFSKVEWRFFSEHNGPMISPEKKQAIEASNKLISKILPILIHEHWPKTN